MRAAILYGRDGVEPSFPEGSREDLLWPTIESQIRRDINAYQKRVKGGANRWSKKVTSPVTENQPNDSQNEVVELQKFIDSMKNTSPS